MEKFRDGITCLGILARLIYSRVKNIASVTYRRISHVIQSKPTLEGAGVKLRRAFGNPELAPLFDPFLLLDDFGSRFPHEYLAGFPWHPHRGIVTVTYLIKGEVHHEDSTGTKGILRGGDIQWMTAGSGIFHSEMPKPLMNQESGEIEDPEMRGLQLWINLPARQKMVVPSYKNLLSKSVPKATLDNGTVVKVFAGEIKHIPGIGNLAGPIADNNVEPRYFDVTVPEHSDVEFVVKKGYTAFVYVSEGEAIFDKESKAKVGEKSVVLYEREGDTIRVITEDSAVHFLLLSGKPLGEPVAWYGPIVMNTDAQILLALQELRNGSFIK
ncbi:MAG: pirin family protein, partial [Conexivisphaerales archaeon]